MLSRFGDRSNAHTLSLHLAYVGRVYRIWARPFPA